MPLTRPSLNQINTTITALNDPLTVLNKGGTTANQDVGFVFNRDGGSTANVAIIWDETNDKFALVNTSDSGVTNANISISSYANVQVDQLQADLVRNREQRYTTSNMMKFNQLYTGAAAGSYFTQNEYQKIVTIIPDGDSQNYQVSGRILCQNAGEIQTINFKAALRSDTLPDLSWSIVYTDDNNGTAHFKPQLWTKETSPAGFIFAIQKISSGTLYGTVTVDLDIIPRTSALLDNVTVNTTQNSEQTSVDTGYTANDMTLVQSISGTDVTFGGDMTVTGNVVPSANVTYNLGSDTMWWNDLYLSGGTIFLGGLEIKDEGGEVKFKKRGTDEIAKIADVTSSVNAIGGGTSNLAVHSDGAIRANVSGTDIFNITSAGIIPTVDSNGSTGFSLGSASYAWKDIYVSAGSLYVNGQKVLQEDAGTIVVSADEDQNINITTTGTGDVELNPGGSIQLKGNVELTAGKTISQAGGAAAEFSAGVKADSVTSRTADTNLTLSANGTGVVNVNDSLTVANDVTVTGNLTVNGATTTVSSTNTTIEDALLLLADGQSGSPTKDAGFVVERGSSVNVAWLWDESADEFVAITTSDDATTVGDVSVTNYANVHASYFLGDGSQLTGLPETYGNTEVLAYLTDNSYATQTYVNTANTNMGGYVDNAVSTANVNLKGYTDGQLASYATTSALTTANTNVVGYVDGEITTVNSTITTANTNVVGYVDGEITTVNSTITTANTNLKGYSDATFQTTSSATTANTNVVGYVDNAVSTANVNLKGYTDGQLASYATTSALTTANTNVVGYVDNAVSTANVNLKGYTDGQLASYATTSALTTANTNVVGYVDGEITTVNSTITTANTNVVGYVDNAVSTANVNLKGYVDAGNTNVVGYVDNAVTTANTNLKGYTDGQLASYATTSALTTANTNMQGYVDNEISSLIDSAPGTLDTLNEIAAALGDDPNLATTLTNTITTANTNMGGYVDGEITTVNSTITTANTNVVGYVDNAVSTANVNLKGYVDAGNTNVVGYVDNAVTTANTNLKGYTDGQLASYATTSALTTANTNMGGYVDNAVSTANVNLKGYVDAGNTNVVGYVDNAVSTANVNLKGYADATFAQQTLTADLDGADTYGIINLLDPTSAQDAVTLSYLESALSSDVTNIGSDDTSVAVTDDGINPGYIELTVDNTVRGNVTSSGINVTGLSIAGTAVTATAAELNYVDGVTSAIQTQLDAKAPTASPTFTGTVSASDLQVDTNVLYVDSTNNRVGINNNATDITGTSLDQLIVGSGAGNQGIVIDSGASGQSRYGFSEAGTIKGGIQYDGTSNQIEFMVEGIATEVGSIDSAGKLSATSLIVTGNVETTGGEVNVKARGEVRFFETDNGQFVALRAPNLVASNVTFNLPGADGTSGQVLQTDGAGTMSWVDQGGGGGGGGSGGFFTSTITTHPAANGDEDLATGPSDDTLETPFDTGGTDEFGVSMGVVYDQMEPQGQYLTYDLGDAEAYVGA